MKNSKMSLVMYIAAALMGILFIYMLISSITYISGYCAQYGMTMKDMGSEAVQYIFSNSIQYLVYGLLLVAAAQVIDAVKTLKSECCEGAQCAAPVAEPAAVACEEVAECCAEAAEACACACEEEKPAAEGWSMDKVPELYTSKLFM